MWGQFSLGRWLFEGLSGVILEGGESKQTGQKEPLMREVRHIHLLVGAGAHLWGPSNSIKTQWDVETFCPVTRMDTESALLPQVPGA